MTDFPDLTRLVRPDSVAIVGASETPGSMGHRTVDNLLHASDYGGRTYLVNPRRDTIAGTPCYRDVASLPETPDVAVIVIPAPGVLPALEQCAAKGVRFAVVLTSGFGETGEDGRAMQQRMRELADSSGMRIYGPNCPGIVNLTDRIGLTFSPAFADDREPGPLGVATQGGGLGRNIVQAAERGAGVALWASLGNAVDLDVADFIHHMAGDDDITVIVTLLEGIRDGAKLLAAVDAATRAGKPVVALKVGRSSYGVRAVRSHTAALAGSAEVTSAVFAQAGVIEVGDIDELVDVAWLLARAPAPGRTRIAVFGGSGGAVSLAADLVGAADLELADLDEGTRSQLREVLPDFAAVGNPVDITATALSEPSLLERSLALVADDPGVDLVLLPTPLDYGPISKVTATSMATVQRQTATALLPVWMSDRRGPGWHVLAEAKFCSPRSLGKAILAVQRWAWYGRWKATQDPDASVAPLPRRADRPGSSATRLPDLSTEARAKAWLSARGVSVPDGIVASSEAEAGAAAEGLPGPLVVKVVSPELAHKSDVGGVVTGVNGPDQAAAAWRRVTANAKAAAPGVRIDGALVERMVADDGVELLVGVHRDPVFGHIMSVGMGGIDVEIVRDVQRRLLPLDQRQATQLIQSLRCFPLLDGARGRPRCDVAGLIELLLTVSDLVAAHADLLDELDLNPVRVRPADSDGPSVIALDALAVPAHHDPGGGRTS